MPAAIAPAASETPAATAPPPASRNTAASATRRSVPCRDRAAASSRPRRRAARPGLRRWRARWPAGSRASASRPWDRRSSRRCIAAARAGRACRVSRYDAHRRACEAPQPLLQRRGCHDFGERRHLRPQQLARHGGFAKGHQQLRVCVAQNRRLAARHIPRCGRRAPADRSAPERRPLARLPQT